MRFSYSVRRSEFALQDSKDSFSLNWLPISRAVMYYLVITLQVKKEIDSDLSNYASYFTMGTVLEQASNSEIHLIGNKVQKF